MYYLDESHILLFLLQLTIILICARVLGEIFRRWKQPVLTAELLVGIILGPTVLGRFFPEVFTRLFPNNIIQQNMLETIAWIGVLFLLLDTGLEINFSAAWKQKSSVVIIAIVDIIIPMLIAFSATFLFDDSYLADTSKRMQFALFIAVVMTISAMPVASKVLHDLRLLKTDLGFLTMSALAINDIIGWTLFTIILGLFTQNVLSISHVSLVLLMTIGFSVLALTIGRYLSNKVINFFHNKHLPQPSTSFTFACVVGIVFGAITQKVGIHALFGFFLAGVVVGEAKNLKDETRSIISQMVHALFVPIFFVNIGLKIDIVANFDLFLVLVITVIGIMGRFLGAWVGASWSKVPKVHKSLIAIAHTPGGMMEIVVALIALELELIIPKVFIAIIFGAVISSILMGPWMSLALRRRKSVTLASYINFDRGILFLDEDNKQDAITRLIMHASQMVKSLETRTLIETIIRREEDFSTALGYGLAIPHARIDEIKNPLLLCAYSKNGIDWNAPDGKEVHIIFFLLSPSITNDVHVEILSKIAKIMQNEENRKKLLQSDTPENLSASIKSVCKDYDKT